MIISMLLRKNIFSPIIKIGLPLSKNSLFSQINKYTVTYQKKTGQLSHVLHDYIQSEASIQILLKKGINNLFPIQAKTYQHIYNGRDVIAGQKTGAGKTMAFALPVIQRLRKNNDFKTKKGIKFVVLSPTRQLAVQIASQINSLAHDPKQFYVTTVYGGVPIKINQTQLQRNPDVLVGTPGRIIDLMQRGWLNFKNVKVTCIDQADYMFDIGFKQSVHQILAQIKNSSSQNVQLLCFSATMSQDVQYLTEQFMRKDKVRFHTQQKDKAPKTIQHYLIRLNQQEQRILALRNLIKTKSNQGRVIIFTNKKSDANYLSNKLKMQNVVLHGDIEQQVRLMRLNKFKKGAVKILIASDVAARGLDIPNVEVVFNYNLPQSHQTYLHRSGRTGRAGKNGVCISIVDNSINEFVTRKITSTLGKPFKNISISPQQYQEQSRSYQQDPSIQTKEEQSATKYSDTQVVFLDQKKLIQRYDVRKYLNEQQIKHKFIKQYQVRNGEARLYKIVFQSKQDANQLVRKQRIYIKDQFFRVQRSKLKTPNPQPNEEESQKQARTQPNGQQKHI